jgi:hypothetical protein
MALSNQSELPALFSPRHVNLKISHRILTNPTIPEDNLTDWLVTAQKISYREWPNLGK